MTIEEKTVTTEAPTPLTDKAFRSAAFKIDDELRPVKRTEYDIGKLKESFQELERSLAAVHKELTEAKQRIKNLTDGESEVYAARAKVAHVRQELAQAIREREEARADAPRLDWLEEHHTLHKSVDILYVVDGYQVCLVHEDGVTDLSPKFEGHDLRAAIDEAIHWSHISA